MSCDYSALCTVGERSESHHSATKALHFPRQHPVREVAASRDLHGAEDGQIDAAGADHGEGFVGAEGGGAGEEGAVLRFSYQ
jgi:hypothetical protein